MTSLTFFRYSCLALLFMVFLTPTLWIPGLLGIRIEELFVLLWVVILAYLLRQGSVPVVYLPIRSVFLIVFALIIATSIAVGSLMQLPASILDLTKFIWLIKGSLIYFIFFNYIYQKDGHEMVRRDYILKWFVRFGVLSAFICFQQYFDLFNLNAKYIPVIAPTQTTTLLSGYFAPRVVGMLGNPNVQGAMLALCMISHLYLCLRGKGEFKLLIFVILFIASVMTLSRSAFLMTVIGCFIVVMLYQKGIRFAMAKWLGFFLLIFLLALAYLTLRENEFLYNTIFFRFEKLLDTSQEGSLVARYERWAANIEYFLKSPIFGVGPLPRADLFEFNDGEWFLLLRTYGLVGLIWFFGFNFAPLLMVRSTHKAIRNLKGFSLAILGAIFLYMFPAALYTSTTTFSFVLILLALYDYPACKIAPHLLIQSSQDSDQVIGEPVKSDQVEREQVTKIQNNHLPN